MIVISLQDSITGASFFCPSISYSSPPLVCYTQDAETNLVSAPHKNITYPIKMKSAPDEKKHRKASAQNFFCMNIIFTEFT